MTESQIFQLLGLALTAVGVGFMVNPLLVKKLLRDLEHSAADVYLTGLTSLTLGFLLVSFYNVWSFKAALIITLIGWSGLLKGISILAFPEFTLKLSRDIIKNDAYLLTLAWLSLVLGLGALYLGYLA